MKRKIAKGSKGTLIIGSNDEIYFRIYNKDKSFIDYKIQANDIEIQIIDDFIDLIQINEKEGYLDYDKSTLGIC